MDLQVAQIGIGDLSNHQILEGRGDRHEHEHEHDSEGDQGDSQQATPPIAANIAHRDLGEIKHWPSAFLSEYQAAVFQGVDEFRLADDSRVVGRE